MLKYLEFSLGYWEKGLFMLYVREIVCVFNSEKNIYTDIIKINIIFFGIIKMISRFTIYNKDMVCSIFKKLQDGK